jgi:metallo-beta-lactamase class B
LDGGTSDYAFGTAVPTFAAFKADRLLHDGDLIKLGGIELRMLHHPGHTKGSSSFTFNVKDDYRTYKVHIVNMPTIVVDQPFSKVTVP